MIRFLYYALRRWFYRRIYLKSRHWKLVRVKALQSANYECQCDGCKVVHPEHAIVPGKPFSLVQWLEVHHLHYRSLWREKPKDVVVLCSYHHAQVELGYEITLKNGAVLPGYKKPEIIFL